MSQCSDILNGTGKLGFSAPNSMNTVSACLKAGDNWTAKNYELYNIGTMGCSLGVDEPCTIDWPVQNQADCPSGDAAAKNPLKTAPVWDINYPNAELPQMQLVL